MGKKSSNIGKKSTNMKKNRQIWGKNRQNRQELLENLKRKIVT